MASCSIHCLHARLARVLRVQAAKEAKQCEPVRVHEPGRPNPRKMSEGKEPKKLIMTLLL
jgi:hypothetical protein